MANDTVVLFNFDADLQVALFDLTTDMRLINVKENLSIQYIFPLTLQNVSNTKYTIY